MWGEMQAKRWLTTAHAVQVVGEGGGGRLMANAFERQPYGQGAYAVALSFGEAGNATVRLALPELLGVEGGSRGVAVSAVATLLDGVRFECVCEMSGAGTVEIVVPIAAEGCAVVAVRVKVRGRG